MVLGTGWPSSPSNNCGSTKESGGSWAYNKLAGHRSNGCASDSYSRRKGRRRGMPRTARTLSPSPVEMLRSQAMEQILHFLTKKRTATWASARAKQPGTKNQREFTDRNMTAIEVQFSFGDQAV